MEKYLADPVWNPQLLEEVSDFLPAPVEVTEAVRKPLDPEILDMVPGKVAARVKGVDKSFLSIATRLGTAF